MESEQLQIGIAAGTQAAMFEPELVRQIHALVAMRWGSKRIARELGVALMTVKRYRRGGAEAEVQHRPTRRASGRKG
jgi:FixJ family two-component response regulator